MACGHCGPGRTHEHRRGHTEISEQVSTRVAHPVPRDCCAGSDRPAPDRVERVPEERVQPGQAG